MFTILRISSTNREIEVLRKLVVDYFPEKSKINRQNDLVIDFSKSEDWGGHCQELNENIDIFLKAFPKNKRGDYEMILDMSLDKPENSDDVAGPLKYCVYNFDSNLLKKLVSNDIELEITIY